MAAAQLNGHAETLHEQPPSSPTPGLLQRPTDLKDKLVVQKGIFADQKDRIKSNAKPPGGFDATPLPDAPPGFTVKFTFIKATNLPAADIGTHSSDPYLIATLRTDAPKRHKQDPLLVRRTRTLHKTVYPQWDEEWIVANVPASGFSLKCRLYDEDWPDHHDRLGNVTVVVDHIDTEWKGFGPGGNIFRVKKHVGSKRAYFIKGITSALSKDTSMTPLLHIGVEVLGQSEPPHSQMYTVGPTRWVKHYSPMIGRLAGIKVNKDEEKHVTPGTHSPNKQTKKYDFQANELQLAGPVPPNMYHRFVEFRPIIGMMFTSHGLRGRILNKALHKQHNRIYNYDATTEYGTFEPCSESAALQFLKMVYFDEGGRIFTYVLTLDGLMRFTETGKEFGIDLLSKHTMHSDVATYIACSGEFFVRRLEHPDGSSDPKPDEATHPSQPLPGGPQLDEPPRDPRRYQLVIDNDSGTYRPDRSTLPDLKAFLERNFPGMGVIAMHWEGEELKKMKDKQKQEKKKEGRIVPMVLDRSSSETSVSSSDESRLGDLEAHGHSERRHRSKQEKAYELVEDPSKLKDKMGLGNHAGGLSKS